MKFVLLLILGIPALAQNFLPSPTACSPSPDLSSGCQMRFYAPNGLDYTTIRGMAGPALQIDKPLTLLSNLILNSIAPTTGLGAATPCVDSTGLLKTGGCPITWYDVRQFGAKCDGTTDDSTAVQNGVTNTAQNGAGLLIPAMCMIKPGLSLPDNSHITGQGPQTGFRLFPNSANNSQPMIVNSQWASSTTTNFPQIRFSRRVFPVRGPGPPDPAPAGLFKAPIGPPPPAIPDEPDLPRSVVYNQHISITNLSIDGNYSQQPAGTGQNGIWLSHVIDVTIDQWQFTNIASNPILFYDAQRLTITHGYCANYQLYLDPSNPTPANVYCVNTQRTNPGSFSIKVNDNVIDGTACGCGGINMVQSTANWQDVEAKRNHITVGTTRTGDRLGIQVWGGFTDRADLSDNYIHSADDSNNGASTVNTYAISAPDLTNSRVCGNRIYYAGAFAIETGTQHVVVCNNLLIGSGPIQLQSTGSTDPVADFTISGNDINDPAVTSAGAYGGVGINLLAQGTGGTVGNGTVTGNVFHFLRPGGSSTHAVAIQLYCNSTGGLIDGVSISGNTVEGPGTTTASPLTNAVFANGASNCPVNHLVITGNTFDNLNDSIQLNGSTNSTVTSNSLRKSQNSGLIAYNAAGIYSSNNVYENMPYGIVNGYGNSSTSMTSANDNFATISSANTSGGVGIVAISNPGSGTNALITTNGGLLLNQGGQGLRMWGNTTNPNTATWNSNNETDCFYGNAISINSRFDGSANWVQTSTNSYSRAAYFIQGACRYAFTFGPAAGANSGGPPYDRTTFVVEDPISIGGRVAGGIGIGTRGVNSGTRLKNMFTYGTYTFPGATIAAGGNYVQGFNWGGGNCAQGDVVTAGLDSLVNESVVFSARANTANSGYVIIYNFGAASVTLAAGNWTFICLSLKP